MTADRWTLTVQALLGQPWPMPAPIPGRLIVAADRPLTDDELADVTSATELAVLLGTSRHRAEQMLRQRADHPHGGAATFHDPTHDRS